MRRVKLTDDKHDEVIKIAYPAALLVHLHEGHGVAVESLTGRSAEWLGIEHTKRHEMLADREPSTTPHVDALVELIHQVKDPADTAPEAATLEEVSDLTRRIRVGSFDRFLEDILAATHGRKRDRREMRRGR